MKDIFSVIFLMLITIDSCSLAEPDKRVIQNFNNSWFFKISDTIDLPDVCPMKNGFTLVDLPHDWAISGSFDSANFACNGFLAGGGNGWYIKQFEVPEASKNRLVFIEFEGIYNNSSVWINGHLLGYRPNGYVSFEYLLSPYLNYGREKNTIIVKADRTRMPDSRWFSGSGINRNVSLKTVNNIHVAQWGTHIQTLRLKDDIAELSLNCKIINTRREKCPISLTHRIIDPGNVENLRLNKDLTLTGDSVQVVRKIFSLHNTKLWNLDDANIYTVQTGLAVNNREVDQYQTTFGVRICRFDPDSGFFLNNQHLKINGVCIHFDAGCFGTAVPLKVWRERLNLLKKINCNAIRMCHNPPPPALLDLCDRMGFLVCNEAFDEWDYPKFKFYREWDNTSASQNGYANDFKMWSDRDLTDFIERDKNHPSIILWSIGNEIDLHDIAKSEETMVSNSKRLCKIVKSIDSITPTTSGFCDIKLSNRWKAAETVDVVGYNYQEQHFATDHRTYPERAIYASESGHGYADWMACKENPFVAGQFIWTAFDYLGEGTNYPQKTFNSGLIDFINHPKPQYYYRQSFWARKPMIYLCTYQGPRVNLDFNLIMPFSKWSLSYWHFNDSVKPVWDCRKDEPVKVICFTNCEEAELLLNNKSAGIRQLKNTREGYISWVLPFEEGELKVRGLLNKKEVASFSIKTPGKPNSILLQADTLTIDANGSDIALIDIELIDKKNELAYTSSDTITAEISGPGKIIGFDSGDPKSAEAYSALSRKAYKGRCRLIVQGTKKRGIITIKASANGIKESSLKIDCK